MTSNTTLEIKMAFMTTKTVSKIAAKTVWQTIAEAVIEMMIKENLIAERS